MIIRGERGALYVCSDKQAPSVFEVKRSISLGGGLAPLRPEGRRESRRGLQAGGLSPASPRAANPARGPTAEARLLAGRGPAAPAPSSGFHFTRPVPTSSAKSTLVSS